ncbi:D-glycero-beta-D-manno-heptose 1-phosphate adenylyltransferase [Streptomyces sp. P1-3]|uniref:D-glycero-beta-D-manno-heptose 1-phosphate adenylyltransferase n=1 Tax=Streptomyces sp. P1-3 TaxID=3421658 RepID=UPI003D36FBB7
MVDPGRSHTQALAEALPRLDTGRLGEWGQRLARRLSRGARLLAAGNGGSAAEVQHLTAELVGRFREERAPLSALALTADSSSVTAIANDYGIEEVFARQVRAHGRRGDVLLLVSASGRSPNVLKAAEAGRELGLETWALTGRGPNPLAEVCDAALCVDAEAVATVQECHLVAVHVLCAAVDAELAALAAGSGPGQADSGPDRRPDRGAVEEASTAVAIGQSEEGPVRRLVVVGDVLLDRDIAGAAERLSPEAPVPVVSGPQTTERPGGAGLAALMAAREPGWRVSLVCGIGRDESGARVRALLAEARVEILDMAADGATPVKTRIRARDRTIVRIDDEHEPVRLGRLPDAARRRLGAAAAVLVCDYGRGVAAHAEVRQALEAAAGLCPVVWDPHPKGPAPVDGVALAVPNGDEARALSAVAGGRGMAEDVQRARALLETWPVKQVAVTRGGGGAVLVASATGHPLAIPGRPAVGDTCGAGDLLAVTAAMRLGAGRLPSHAVAAGVEAATAYVAGGGPGSLARPTASTITAPTTEKALAMARRVRERGGKVVAAGGCFDLLHGGHVSLLQQARQLGDVLVVCVNSDASVARLKGPSRPVVGERERAALLEALACVDGVLIFGEDTPESVLAELRPDVWVKGGDYAGQRIPESDLVESWGGQVVVVPYLEGRSTTSLIARAAQKEGAR